MGPHKSLGPNGFNVSFFQQHWTMVGDTVCDVVLSILHGAGMNPSLNSTFIALIPKSNDLSVVSDYRPINLCNILYKLVFKIIFNRLKYVMPFLIVGNQSAFYFIKINY